MKKVYTKSIQLLLVMQLVFLGATAQTWSALGSGMDTTMYGSRVETITKYKNEIHVGGSFMNLGGLTNSTVANGKWDGSSWAPVDPVYGSVGGHVSAMLEHNNKLYFTGNFQKVTLTCWNMAEWDGTVYRAVGAGGLGGDGVSMSAGIYSAGKSLAVYNNNLYGGGYFSIADGDSCIGIAKWNGSDWDPVGNASSLNLGGAAVFAMAVYKNELYVGGGFTKFAGIICNGLAKWNGTSWSAVGTGVSKWGAASFAAIHTLKVINNELYIGGEFDSADGVSADNIAKWDGSKAYALGSGVNSVVYAIESYNGEVYAGGKFSMAGGQGCKKIAKWNGSSWSDVNGGVDSTVYALYSDNSDLYVGGMFYHAGSITAHGIAKWSIAGAGIKESQASGIVTMYPNPSNEMVMLEKNNFQSGDLALKIIDAIGKTISIQQIFTNTDKEIINTGAWQNGIYSIQVLSNEKIVSNQKLIVIH